MEILYAFVGSAYDFFENDLKLTIHLYCNNDLNNPEPEDIYNGLMEEVWKKYKESEKFYLIIKELQNLALILETEPNSSEPKGSTPGPGLPPPNPPPGGAVILKRGASWLVSTTRPPKVMPTTSCQPVPRPSPEPQSIRAG